MSIAITLSGCNRKELKIGYAGEDISSQITVLKDKNTKSITFDIKTSGKWSIYRGNSTEIIDLSKAVLEGIGADKYTIEINDSIRDYYQFVTDKGQALIAESHLPMAGGYNFRDMGGLKNKDGRYIKWGKIFRSDDLHNLSKTDLAYLSSIPIKNIVDFRAESEILAAPDLSPASLVKNYAYSITPGQLNFMEKVMSLSEIQMDSAMMDMNRLLVSDSASVKRYKDFFALLQDEKNTPLLFHCSAGKDRTGMGATLILYALGIDEETIQKEYLLSNKYLAGKYDSIIVKHPNIKPLLTVSSEYQKAGIDFIKLKYGSVDNYLTKVLGIDIPKFREMYLY